MKIMAYTGTRTPDRHMNRYSDADGISVIRFESKAPNAVPFFDIHIYGCSDPRIHLQNYRTMGEVMDEIHYLTGRPWGISSVKFTEIPAESEGRHHWSHGAARHDFKMSDSNAER
jgi:hypothetical protein